MNYYIKTTENVATAIQRIAKEQTRGAQVALVETKSQEKGIHLARKHFKKLRALVRLIRFDLGKAQYSKQNIYFRDMGRKLSNLRDATTLLEALHLLRQVYEDHVRIETFQELEDLLIEEREQLKLNQLNHPDQVNEVIIELEKSDQFIQALSYTPNNWKGILRGLHQVYQRGYHAHLKSNNRPTEDDLHEWRKQSKYLWNHFRLIQEAWGPIFRGFITETRQLSDLLGNHRDLILLRSKIKALEGKLDPKSAQIIDALAGTRQQVFFESAQVLSNKIYAETPKAFAKRIGKYMESWHLNQANRESKSLQEKTSLQMVEGL